VSPSGANADSAGLGCNTGIADIDIVIARGEIGTGAIAYCDVVVPIVV
jgi:hypothetical protein